MSRQIKLRGCAAIATALVFTAAAAVPALGDQDQWKFTNKTGMDAQDLHLKWKKGTPTWPGGAPTQDPANTFPGASGSGTSTTNFRKAFTGTGVANDGSLVMTFEFTGTKPVLEKAWWTFNNSLETLGADAKPLKVVDAMKNEWAMTPASGDGLVAVTIDRVRSVFQTTPGDTGVATAQKFAQFVSTLPFGDVMALADNSVTYNGLSFSDDMDNLIVDVMRQDSTQPLSVTSVPEPSGLAGLALASVLLARRRRRRCTCAS
jgi:hypothetical protein